jgi:hypothetical protein
VHWGPWPMRREFSRYIGPGLGEPRRGPLISKKKSQHVPGASKQSCSTLQISLGGPPRAHIYTTTHRNKNVNVDKIKHIYCIEYLTTKSVFKHCKKHAVVRLWSLPWQEKHSHKKKIFLTWKIVYFRWKLILHYQDNVFYFNKMWRHAIFFLQKVT